jgi:hypothetical protein
MRFCQQLFLTLALLLVWNMPVSSAEKNDAVLESISFHSNAEKGEDINFKLNGEHAPKITLIQGENPRVVLDFLDTRCSPMVKRNLDTNGKLTRKIRVGIHNDPTQKTRVVVDLAPNGEYQYTQHFKVKDNTLLLTIFSNTADADRKEKEKKEEKAKIAKVPDAKKTVPAVQKEPAQQPKVADNKKAVASKKDEGAVKAPGNVESMTQEPESTSALTHPPDTAAADITIPPKSENAMPEIIGEKKTAIEKEKKIVPETEAPPGSKSAGKKPEPLLSAVTFEKTSAKGEMVIFKLNGFFPPKVVGIEKGKPSVVCDFLNTRLGDQVKEVVHCQGRFVESVQVIKQKKQNQIRVILRLVPGRNYDLQQVFFKEDNLFVIIVNSQDTLQVENTTAAP